VDDYGWRTHSRVSLDPETAARIVARLGRCEPFFKGFPDLQDLKDQLDPGTQKMLKETERLMGRAPRV
jgi:hypothetical protein